MILVKIDAEFDQAIETVIFGAVTRAVEFAGAGKDWVDHWDCSVIVTDDESVQYYNSVYRGIDKPTDVLSFESHEVDPATNAIYLGDIIISYPTILKQATKGGHALEKELELMCVHGSLHLLGYDHLEDEEKEEMWALQTEILSQLGNGLRPA